MTAAAQLALMFRARKSYAHQWQLYRERQKQIAKYGSSQRRNLSVFYASSVMLLIALPMLAATFIARSITDLHFGVDLAITLPYVFGYVLYLCTLGVVEHQLFRIMVSGVGSERAAEMIHADFKIKFYGTLVYSIVYAATMISQVFLPIGTNAARIALVLTHNVSTTLYFFMYFQSHTLLTSKLRALLDTSRGGVNASDNERLSKVLTSLIAATKQAREAVVVLALLTLVFSVVPQLYAFSYVKNAFLLLISTGKNHPLLMMSNGSNTSSNAAHRSAVQQQQTNDSKLAMMSKEEANASNNVTSVVALPNASE